VPLLNGANAISNVVQGQAYLYILQHKTRAYPQANAARYVHPRGKQRMNCTTSGQVGYMFGRPRLNDILSSFELMSLIRQVERRVQSGRLAPRGGGF